MSGCRGICCTLCGFTASTALIFCSAVERVYAEPFIGQFELKTLQSEPDSFEFQSQNAWAWGQPERLIAADEAGGFLVDENAVVHQRHALELEMGLTRAVKMRVGIEFEKERLDEPATIEAANAFDSLSLTEIGAEVIVILTQRHSDGLGLGVVGEVEGPIDQEEPNHLTLGAIIEFQSGQWFAAAIPMAVHAFGGDPDLGERSDHKWDFAYAAQLMHRQSDDWMFALEAYGTVERLGATGHPSESAQRFGDFDQHRLGPVLYHTRYLKNARSRSVKARTLFAPGADDGAALSIGLGLLEGLNGNTPDHTLKLTVEIDF